MISTDSTAGAPISSNVKKVAIDKVSLLSLIKVHARLSPNVISDTQVYFEPVIVNVLLDNNKCTKQSAQFCVMYIYMIP